MRAYDYAELFLNSKGSEGEKEFREYIANGGDINERDRDGMSAMDIAKCDEFHSKSMKIIAPKLIEIIESLGGV